MFGQRLHEIVCLLTIVVVSCVFCSDNCCGAVTTFRRSISITSTVPAMHRNEHSNNNRNSDLFKLLQKFQKSIEHPNGCETIVVSTLNLKSDKSRRFLNDPMDTSLHLTTHPTIILTQDFAQNLQSSSSHYHLLKDKRNIHENCKIIIVHLKRGSPTQLESQLETPNQEEEMTLIDRQLGNLGMFSVDKFIFEGDEETLKYFSSSTLKSNFLQKFQFAFTHNVLNGETIELRSRKIEGDNSVKKIDLSNRYLKLAGISVPPLVIFGREKNEIIGGTFLSFFDTASKYYNFTYDINTKIFRNGGPGRLTKNGTWSGVIGGLHRHDCDVTFIGHHVARYPQAYFTTPLFFDESIFVAGLPNFLVRWDAILAPFAPFVWALIVLATLSFIPTLYISILRREKDVNIQHEKLYLSFAIPYCVTIEQGIDLPRSVRSLGAIWIFAMMILGTGYKDKLIAFLTFPDLDVVPKNLFELNERPDYEIFLDGVLISYRLRDHGSAVIKKLVSRLQMEKNTINCVLAATMKPKTVCMGYKPMVDLAIAQNLTINYEFKATIDSENLVPAVPVSVGLRKDSLISQDWERISRWYRDAYLYEKSKQRDIMKFKGVGRKWMHQNPSQVSEKLINLIERMANKPKKLTVEQFYVIFAIHFSSCFLTLPVFLVELELLKLHQIIHNGSCLWFRNVFSKVQNIGKIQPIDSHSPVTSERQTGSPNIDNITELI